MPKRRVIFTAFATEGHVDPIFAIAIMLMQWGVDVTVITHAPYALDYQLWGLKIAAIDTREEFNELISHISLLNHPGKVPEFFDRFVFPVAEREIAAIREIGEGEVSLIVSTDAPGIGARIAAEALGAPFASVFTAPGFLVSRPLYAAMLETHFADRIQRLRAAVGVNAKLQIDAWLNMAEINLALWPSWFTTDLTNDIPRLDHMDFTWSEPPRMARTDPATCVRDKVLISGGSSGVAGERFFRTAVEGCALAGLTGRVVSHFTNLLPSPLPDGFVHVRREPDLMLSLRRALIAVHHGGMGMTGRSVVAGIPQLILASGGDRPLNAKCVERLGVGYYLPLPEWIPSAVAGSLRQIMESTHIAQRATECCQRSFPDNGRAAARRLADHIGVI